MHVGETILYVGSKSLAKVHTVGNRPDDRFSSSFYEFMLVTDLRSLDVDDVTCNGPFARVESTHVDETLLNLVFGISDFFTCIK